MYSRIAVAALILTTIDAQATESQDFSEYKCDVNELPKRDSVCVAQIDCSYGIDDISTKLQNWDCIRREHKRYNYDYDSYETYTTYASNYDLIVYVENIYEHNAINNFGNIKDKFEHVKTITISHGNLVSIPAEIYRMIKATEVEISNTQLEEVTLNNFLDLTMLNKINVSHNSIAVIRTDEESARPSGVTTIDLSYNLIETLPNNCFVHFTQLEHLDLSNNHISRFDILTFEGISQLQTLHLSNNKIIEIGNTLARFINLQKLSLDNNHLTRLLDYNFGTMTKLITLNLSANYIEHIEDHTFQSLVKLEFIDLGYNRLKIFSRLLLEKNNNLVSISLLHNQINCLETRSFKGKNITDFDITGNSLTGAIENDTFRGIFVNDLNLSGGKITTLGDEAFSALQLDLLTLNLSSNSISNISKSAFRSLGLLTKLDLSFNNLQYLNFETNDLKKLSILYAHNNSIISLNKDSFKYLTSLTELDLSCNLITEIRVNAFADLKSLKLLIIKQNTLNNVFEANSFQGLVALERIELENTRTSSYRDRALSGMLQLKTVNSSFGQLSDIGYNAFEETGSLEVLDLSHNLIEHFSINTTTIIQIKNICLNNNLLRNITNHTFSNLTSMNKLNLANNNILKIQSLAFSSLSRLFNLDLSSNSRMQISDNVFDNLTSLSEVSLAHVQNRFNFQNSNATIRILELTLCDIEDINKLFIFKIKNLSKLNLSRNKLSFIDKFSFQTMSALYWLDLSTNMITSIQPGSFLYLNMLSTLNLAGNDIPSLQFGVFDGLHNLRELNLSHNAIHNFDPHLLHNTPHVSTVYLDFNVISVIDFNIFSETQITKLSIGGNLVPCETLAMLKKSNFTKFEITAEVFDYNSENVNGVLCRTAFNVNSSIKWPVANDTGVEITSAFASFSNAVENFRKSIENIGYKSADNNTDDLMVQLKKVVKSIEDFISINKTQYPTNEYLRKTDNSTNDLLNKLTDFSNETLLYFAEISKYLRIQSNEIKTLTEHQGNGGSKMAENKYSEYMQIINEKTESLRLEFKSMFHNWQKSMDNTNDREAPIAETNLSAVNFADIKALLYCMVIFLAIILIINSMNVICNFFRKKKYLSKRNLRNSKQPIGNAMELA